jgi:ABC-type glycerol-3-phosphate transport system permease component
MKHRNLTGPMVAALVVVYAILPVLWLLRVAVTPEAEIHRWPPTFVPTAFTFGHFGDVLTDGRFWQQAGNTLAICIASTTLALSLAALGAYGLARGRKRFAAAIIAGTFGLHLIPGVANMTSVYRIAEGLSALDSLLFVALLKSGGVALALVILYAAFRSIPERLEQAAMLDGLTRVQAATKVTLPLAGPSILTAGVVLFVGAWNTFFLPFLLLEDPSKMTLTVGLYRYFTEHGMQQGHVSAFMTLAILPVLALFLLFRNRLWSRLETWT